MWSKVKSKGYRLRCSNWCCYHPLHECEKPFMLLLLPFTSSLRRLGSSCVGSFLRDCWIDPRALFKLSSLFFDAFFVVSWIGTHNFLIFVFCFPEFVDEFKFVPLFFESLLLPYFWESGSNDCSGWQLAVDFIALNNLLNQNHIPYPLETVWYLIQLLSSLLHSYKSQCSGWIFLSFILHHIQTLHREPDIAPLIF